MRNRVLVHKDVLLTNLDLKAIVSIEYEVGRYTDRKKDLGNLRAKGSLCLCLKEIGMLMQ